MSALARRQPGAVVGSVASQPASSGALPERVRWPQQVSHEPVMKIGELVEMLRPSFPALSISKVRYLEAEGLIHPHRLGNGYRRYSRADAERLRYTLAAQRDEYLPLSVIRERLEELDAGRGSAPRPSVVAADGSLVPDDGLDLAQVATRAGADLEQVEELVSAGVVSLRADGTCPAGTVRIVRAALEVHASGVPLRNLRAVRSAARREADVVSQALSVRRRQEGEAQDEARTAAGRAVAGLHELLLLSELAAGH